MKLRNKFLPLSVTAILVWGNPAWSAAISTSCPLPSDITQAEGEYGGYAYSAPIKGTGLAGKWEGENAMADEKDLEHFTFKEANLVVNAKGKHFVACDYTTG
jgi:hypothetical protein